MRKHARLALGFVALAACACGNEPAKTALGYTDSAKHAYELAMEQFRSHNWLQAQTLLHEVKRKYSYSKYARMAELRLADADYEQEKYSEAIHEYKDFVRTHRTDTEDIEYARSKIAEAMYSEIPESFLMPSPEERDQGAVVDAYKELKSYLADYPTAKEASHVRELLSQAIGRLLRHELYVARFYLKKDNYKATVARIEYALHNYAVASEVQPEASQDLVSEALVLLGETYLKMEKWSDARATFESVVRDYDRTPHAVQARNYLVALRARGV